MIRALVLALAVLASRPAAAKAQLEVVLSARLCAQRDYQAEERRRLRDEQRIGRIGGVVNLRELHAAARALREVELAIAETRKALRVNHLRALACSDADVDEVEGCLHSLPVGPEASTPWGQAARCRPDVEEAIHFARWAMDEVEDAELDVANAAAHK